MFIVDIQGFQFKDSEFIIREIAIYDMQTNFVEHKLIKLQHSITWFSPNVRKHMQWCTKNVHGLPWEDRHDSDNNISQPSLLQEAIGKYLRDVIDDDIILVKGLNKKKVLEKFLPNIILIIINSAVQL